MSRFKKAHILFAESRRRKQAVATTTYLDSIQGKAYKSRSLDLGHMQDTAARTSTQTSGDPGKMLVSNVISAFAQLSDFIKEFEQVEEELIPELLKKKAITQQIKKAFKIASSHIDYPNLTGKHKIILSFLAQRNMEERQLEELRNQMLKEHEPNGRDDFIRKSMTIFDLRMK